MLGFWVLGIPLGIALAYGAEMGPRGMWWGLAAGLMSVAVLLLLRIRTRLSGSLERIHVEEDEAR